MSSSKRNREKVKVQIYSKPDCHLCDEVKAVIQKVQQDLPVDLEEVDITGDARLFETFKEQIPVVFINGRKAFKYRVSESQLRKKIKEHL